MQTLNIVQTPNYDLDRYNISIDDKITSTEIANTLNTVSTVHTVLKFSVDVILAYINIF